MTGINYTLPISKLPLLDWVTANARYQVNYRWQASPKSLQARFGNQIENSSNIQLNGSLSFDRIYDKIPGLKKDKSATKPAAAGGMTRPGMQQQQQKKSEQDTVKKRET